MRHPMIAKISVVVATRHNYNEVRRRISSMLPERGIELLVVEDQGRGVSLARNRGLDHANGEWVLMVDDDDVIHPGMIEALRSKLSTIDNIDMLEWGYRITKGSEVVQRVQLVQDTEIHCCGELVELMVDNKRFTSNLWNKLIRRSSIGNLRFNEELSYGEDWDFLWRLISSKRVRSMAIIADILYDYVQHPNQVSAQMGCAQLTLPNAWSRMLTDIASAYPSLAREAHATYASQLTVVLYAAYKAHVRRGINASLRRALRAELWSLWLSSRHSIKKKLAATWLAVISH